MCASNKSELCWASVEDKKQKSLCLKHLCLCASLPVQLVWLSSEDAMQLFLWSYTCGQAAAESNIYVHLPDLQSSFCPYPVMFNHQALSFFLTGYSCAYVQSLQGQSTIVPVFLLMFFFLIRAQGLATSSSLSKLITSLLGPYLRYCSSLRLGSTGAKWLCLFWEGRICPEYCGALASQGKWEMPLRSSLLLLGHKGKVARSGSVLLKLREVCLGN